MCQVPGCGSAIDPANMDVQEHGAVIVVKYTCNKHHSGDWCSSPYVGKGKAKVGVLNVVLATFSLACGLHISQVLKMKLRILPCNEICLTVRYKQYLYNLLGPGLFLAPAPLHVWTDVLLHPAKEPVGEGCVACLVRLSGRNNR